MIGPTDTTGFLGYLVLDFLYIIKVLGIVGGLMYIADVKRAK